ncbi:bifunctional diaminohydroxyphosphoribosylaminopyrimidine deaminase/5-amino-6-(5-phosphoribosylamino)uracil reductase RibD [Nonomuraea sp. KM90]|uniref:bifunctional diaminohydroxyphosphoribosylaminopyrimidine deaminase/5-amino-6-(5-phosphoribosylamino)uracil reductase RibD n=1 Tax=Nonomuraea sp. KM90 TaxID=3457428 RepID=UPI003FCDF389
MEIPAQDAAHMARAVELAGHGHGTTSPNPVVGCVVLDADGRVAGEGFHAYAGGPHAEVVALAQAGERARGGTAYVTLEPCDHTGRTGPCSRALLEAGVARVVIAVPDPNPKAAGGAARLRAHGVAVTSGVLTEAAERVNEEWLTYARLGRPHVTWKFAATLDGRSAAEDGTSKWITSPEARADVHRLRAASDAIVAGIGTVLADDPHLTARPGSAYNPGLVARPGSAHNPGLMARSGSAHDARPTVPGRDTPGVRGSTGAGGHVLGAGAGDEGLVAVARGDVPGVRDVPGTGPDGAGPDGARLDGARLDGARLDGARLDGAGREGAGVGRWGAGGGSLVSDAGFGVTGGSSGSPGAVVRGPLRVVVDPSARTPRDARVLDDQAPTLVAVADDVDTDLKADLLRLPRHDGGGLDLHALLRELAARGVVSVFLEGGPTLAGAFVEQGLVDRVVAYLAPALLGSGRAALGAAGVRTIGELHHLKFDEISPIGPDVRLIARPTTQPGREK